MRRNALHVYIYIRADRVQIRMKRVMGTRKTTRKYLKTICAESYDVRKKKKKRLLVKRVTVYRGVVFAKYCYVVRVFAFAETLFLPRNNNNIARIHVYLADISI